jgi:hypothetical protein
MNEKSKGVTYVRDPRTRNENAPYELKFRGWINSIAEAKAKGAQFIIIAYPWVIGDTYEEISESLSRMAGSGVALHIVRPGAKPADN